MYYVGYRNGVCVRQCNSFDEAVYYRDAIFSWFDLVIFDSKAK